MQLFSHYIRSSLEIIYLPLEFHAWYEIEIYTRDNSWQRILIDDVTTYVK